MITDTHLLWIKLSLSRIAITALFFLGQLTTGLNAQVAKTGGEIAEHLLVPVGKEAAENATKAAMKEAGATAVQEAAAQTSKRTEFLLAEAASAYGDEVLVLARRVPESSALLATNAKQLLPLAEKMGDDILRLEARAPGFGELASKFYGRQDIARLLKLPKNQMQSVIALSTHATEPRAAQLLLEGTEKGGEQFLKNLSPKVILSTGLSVATVVAAYRAPEATVAAAERMGGKLLAPISYALAALLLLRFAPTVIKHYKRTKDSR